MINRIPSGKDIRFRSLKGCLVETKNIVVVGGGPAGLMAAIRAAELLQKVILVEKNPILGKKLLLSGKGRCNLTNACDQEAFLKRFSKSGEFLRDAFKKFFNRDLIDFFEKRGLKLKVERQLRVFPVTDKSNSILEVLNKELQRQKVKIIFKMRMKDVLLEDARVKGLLLGDGRILPCDKLILACGGVTYSFTGSSGEGLEIAKKLGHVITALDPGLSPLEIRQRLFLEGLTLKNIRLKFSDGKRQIISDIGELLFTGSGISGPLVLTLSGRIAPWLKEKKRVYVEIDLKPALSRQQLDARLLREFHLHSRQNIKNALQALLPKRLVDVFIELAGLTPQKQSSQVTLVQRQRLIVLFKSWRLDILRLPAIEDAMITRGGVSLKDINPRTMESRKVKGLYFAGEMIDVDADTGGFNLQAAFSTGYLAGESAALS